jgi:hypothetical protein
VVLTLLKNEKCETLKLFCALPTSLKKKVIISVLFGQELSLCQFSLRSEKDEMEAPKFQMEYIKFTS